MTRRDPTRFWMILEEGQFIANCGELISDREKLFGLLGHVDSDARVYEWCIDENSTRDVTEDMVREALNEGFLDGEDQIVWANSLTPAYPRTIVLANRADHDRKTA